MAYDGKHYAASGAPNREFGDGSGSGTEPLREQRRRSIVERRGARPGLLAVLRDWSALRKLATQTLAGRFRRYVAGSFPAAWPKKPQRKTPS
jgi:hypothetical protein